MPHPNFIILHLSVALYISIGYPEIMRDLINSVGDDYNIAQDDPNFNKEYSQYISFDNTTIISGQQIMMHIKVGNYTKDYKITVWWRPAS